MKRTLLTENEKKVLYGLVRYPELNDRELSQELSVKLSTLTSIKRRLIDQGYFRKLTVPVLSLLGSELLAIIHTRFNPVIPLEDRVKKTKKTIEVFEELFFSVGEQEKGFSISLSENYSNINRINEIRTETFGKVGLLENEYPEEVIFPFSVSKIIRFFDFARVLKDNFNLDYDIDNIDNGWFKKIDDIYLTDKEKYVFRAIVKNPDATTKDIGDMVDLSRHTVSRMRTDFFEKGLLRKLVLPSLDKLGFEILAFYHIRFNPHKHPEEKDLEFLDSPSTIFFACKKFEAVLISAYHNYQDYKEDKMSKIRFLKENDFVSENPIAGKYMYERMIVIKDFVFEPIVSKVLDLEH